MWYIYTMEYYSAVRKKKTLPFATPRVNPEGIMLSEEAHLETQILCGITYMCNLKKPNLQKRTTELWLPGVGELRELGR